MKRQCDGREKNVRETLLNLISCVIPTQVHLIIKYLLIGDLIVIVYGLCLVDCSSFEFDEREKQEFIG